MLWFMMYALKMVYVHFQKNIILTYVGKTASIQNVFWALLFSIRDNFQIFWHSDKFDFCRRHCFAYLREASVYYITIFVSLHSLKITFRKELDCMQEYWWLQSNLGYVTYNALKSVLHIWHYPNGECNQKKVRKFLKNSPGHIN